MKTTQKRSRASTVLPEKLLMTPHLHRHRKTDSKSEILSGVQTGNRIWHDGRNVHNIGHEDAHVFRKVDFLGKDHLT